MLPHTTKTDRAESARISGATPMGQKPPEPEKPQDKVTSAKESLDFHPGPFQEQILAESKERILILGPCQSGQIRGKARAMARRIDLEILPPPAKCDGFRLGRDHRSAQHAQRTDRLLLRAVARRNQPMDPAPGNPRGLPTAIEAMHQTLSKEDFEQQFECRFIAAGGQVISRETFRQCLRDDFPLFFPEEEQEDE